MGVSNSNRCAEFTVLPSAAADCVFCPQESLIDASEDSQLEAAIRASLQETHYESSNVPDAPDSPRSEDESDAEPFSDSEGPISVDGSDSETPAPHEEKSSASKQTQPPSATAAQQRLHPDSSTSSHRKSPYKENNHSHKKEESKKNHLEPSSAGSHHPQPDADSGGNHCTSQTKSAGTSITSTTTCEVDCPDDNGTTDMNLLASCRLRPFKEFSCSETSCLSWIRFVVYLWSSDRKSTLWLRSHSYMGCIQLINFFMAFGTEIYQLCIFQT